MYDALVLTQSISLVRYLGPYVAVRSARAAGYRVKVIEYFTYVGQIFDLVRAHVSPRTRYVVISTTFLYNSFAAHHQDFDVQNARFSSWRRFKQGNLNLWLESSEALADWLDKLRACLPKTCKLCLAGERVNKIYQHYRLIDDDHPIKTKVDYYLVGRDDDLMLHLLSGATDRFEVKHNKFIVGRGSAEFKNREIPRDVFTDDDAIGEHEVLPMEISRGCAFNCSYCNYDKRTVNKMAEHALHAQFSRYHERFGTQNYHFTTECFNDNLPFVQSFHRVATTLPFKIQWASFARPDLCARYPEVIDMMLESGAVSNFFGVETINREVGKRVGRGLAFDDTLAVFEAFKKKAPDYWIKAFFIIGLPNETWQSLANAAHWIKNQRTINSISAQVLDVEPYESDLQALSDFAAFSISPQKYGFEELQFEPEYYWRHATLDINQAYELQALWLDAIEQNPYMAPVGSLTYLDLLMLGVDREDIRRTIHSGGGSTLADQTRMHVASYFDRLVQGI